jgi:hypothetical protein
MKRAKDPGVSFAIGDVVEFVDRSKVTSRYAPEPGETIIVYGTDEYSTEYGLNGTFWYDGENLRLVHRATEETLAKVRADFDEEHGEEGDDDDEERGEEEDE